MNDEQINTLLLELVERLKSVEQCSVDLLAAQQELSKTYLKGHEIWLAGHDKWLADENKGHEIWLAGHDKWLADENKWMRGYPILGIARVIILILLAYIAYRVSH